MISIIHPSRSRPNLCWQTLCDWTLNADNGKNIEYIICVDEDDPKLPEYKYWITEVSEGIILHIGKHKSAIEAINAGAKKATGDLFIVVSDDFSAPKGWDTSLLKELEGKKDYCVKTYCGTQGWIITLPIMDRIYYNRFRYIYNPIYTHCFSDTEMTSVAWILGKYLSIPLGFQHNHYLKGLREKDELDYRNDTTMQTGKKIFQKRVKQNFGISAKELLPTGSIDRYL